MPHVDKIAHRIYNREWYRKDSIKNAVSRRTQRRRTKINTGKKCYYSLIKRSYTGYCEICGRLIGEEIGRVGYHHWDDTDLKPGSEVKGIWTCNRCHPLCEAVDKGELHLIQRYLRLKRVINKEWKTKKKIKPELN